MNTGLLSGSRSNLLCMFGSCVSAPKPTCSMKTRRGPGARGHRRPGLHRVPYGALEADVLGELDGGADERVQRAPLRSVRPLAGDGEDVREELEGELLCDGKDQLVVGDELERQVRRPVAAVDEISKVHVA